MSSAVAYGRIRHTNWNNMLTSEQHLKDALLSFVRLTLQIP